VVGESEGIDIGEYERRCLQVLSQLMGRAREAASLYADDRHALCFFQRRLVQTARARFSEFVTDDMNVELFVSLCDHVAHAVYVRPQLAYDGPAISEAERAANLEELRGLARSFLDAEALAESEEGAAEEFEEAASPARGEGGGRARGVSDWRLSDSDDDEKRGHSTSDVMSVSDACSDDNSDFVEDVIQAELMQIDARMGGPARL
jgi:hypothetical protein